MSEEESEDQIPKKQKTASPLNPSEVDPGVCQIWHCHQTHQI